MRRSLHLLLALSLLFLSWYQYAHELTAHTAQPAQDCEICIFTGHLGHGVMPAAAAATPPPAHTLYAQPHYSSPTLAQPFLLVLSERGPPPPSIA